MTKKIFRMANQLTSNAEALRLFFTEDVYLVKTEPIQAIAAPPVDLPKVQIEEPVTVAPASIPAIENKPVVAKNAIVFEYLGKNQKRILILVNDSSNKVSTPQGTELLRKLVKAIGLTNNDFALVNYANYQGTSFETLHQFFNCELVLAFGVGALHLGLSDQPLHVLTTLGNARLVFANNLHDLDADQTSKRTLWATLQTLK